MRHASDRTLDLIEPLLEEFRTQPEIVERKRGIWYLRSRAFLHFHEDPAGIFADLRVGSDFERFPVNSARERDDLVRRVLAALAEAHRSRFRRSSSGRATSK